MRSDDGGPPQEHDPQALKTQLHRAVETHTGIQVPSINTNHPDCRKPASISIDCQAARPACYTDETGAST